MRWRPFLSSFLLGPALAGGLLQAQDKAPPSRQAPEILPLITPANPKPEVKPAAHANDKFLKGKAPVWVWGDHAEKAYRLKKTFTTDAKEAAVFISCDNAGTVFINGTKVASDVPWDEPKAVDISKHLKAGENELVAEVRNRDGAAAFLCSVALTRPDGKVECVVTDDSWSATELDKPDAAVAVVKTLAKLGDAPWYDVVLGKRDDGDPTRGMFRGLNGFQVERLYTVPKDDEGSWVAMTIDEKGRIIASDQGDKGLYRITPSPIGSDQPTLVEKISAKITGAQGLLFAFGSLYVSVNGGPGSGLYKVRDTNGDDQLDEVTKLATFRGGGEHGPHALRLSPDGASLYVICGNHTLPPEKLDASRLPSNWQEDLVLPRMWDANGHAVGIMAPGGWVAKTDRDGKTWEVVTSGYRNPYDMDFNADGELFVYDADMEWDFGSPWYRPTRVNHATSGSELGWRSGSGKWPTYYVDSLPPLAEIGPGSPVGVAFGYGAKFPAKYQKALYICDWTFGTMYAVHLEPDGASYRSTVEEFVSRTPLPLTDCEIGPDGAMYFTVGGRGTQSELYRVTYVGADPTATTDAHDEAGKGLRELRKSLEAFHGQGHPPEAVLAAAWPNLSHSDRFVRYAARVAIEHLPVDSWKGKAFAETNPDATILAALALARQGDKGLEAEILQKLNSLEFAKLDARQQLDWLRTYQVTLARMGEAAGSVREQVIAKLDPLYPAKSDLLNRELCHLLVALKAPSVVSKTIRLIETEPKSEIKPWMTNLDRNAGYGGAAAAMLKNQPDQQKIAYVFDLRNLKEGWTMDERKAFFGFIDKARGWSGGASYRGFLRNIDRESFEALPEKERLAIEAAGARKPDLPPTLPAPAGPGHEWTFDEVLTLGDKLKIGRDFQNGEKTFASARCILCHRFGGDGGATGPDLTQAAGRFGFKDLADATLNPSKVISDQYKASTVETKAGKVHTGRIVSETEQQITLLLNPEDATKIVTIPRSEIEEIQPSAVSIMPGGLLKTLNEGEVLDLMAYILSRGNSGDAMFRKAK